VAFCVWKTTLEALWKQQNQGHHCGNTATGKSASSKRRPTTRSQKRRRERDLRMTKLSTMKAFPIAQERTETALEKTARAVQEINHAETEERQDKMARVRKARHESEASELQKAAPTKQGTSSALTTIS
jgi:hypothetical protein